ncbi:MAG: lipase [Acidobacteria bacterium]|nr:lipase [Acidobacteriota bacterium]MBV9475805.1 lipase [Acidobacteriota bacterium]
MRYLFLALLLATSAHAQLTPDFQKWLQTHGYGAYDFARADVPGGSFGGRTSARQRVRHEPVIFIHGNSDSALGTGVKGLTGWRASIDEFQAHGYTPAELYATTWGPADLSQALLQTHSDVYVTRLRAFIEAVKAYTGAKRVDIVAHSMGVTLARRVIAGGGTLGAPLTSSIDTFVGIAGANRGLAGCALAAPGMPACNPTDGFAPTSAFLAALNTRHHYEGAHVYTIWSSADNVIGFKTLVGDESTCRIPGQDAEVTYDAEPYTHIGVKDHTAEVQWRMVEKHIATK